MTAKHAILTSLFNVHPCRLPELAILVDANNLLAHPLTPTELRQHLERLESAGLIVSVRDELRDQITYRITADGIALLRS